MSNCQARRASRIESGQLPVAGRGERPDVRRSRLRAGVEQPGLLGAHDPLAPQVGEVLAGLGLEEVEQPAPVRRPVHGLGGDGGRCRARAAGRARGPSGRRLVGAGVRGGVGPDAVHGVVAGALGDPAGQRERGRVPVGLRRPVDRGVRPVAVGATGRARARRVRPGVERDRREADAGADLGARVADLERPGHPLRVVRREPLARPAVRDEAAVEPAVRGLVEDDQGIGPVRDLDPPVGGREQAGVPAGGPAHRLLDDRLPGLRPREPDRVAQPRQRLAEQAADPRAPRRVVAPAAQQEVDLVVARRHRERRLLEHGVLLRAEVREVVQRLAEGLGREERPAVRGLRLAVERPALHVDRVARREADLHAAPARPVRRERPDRERHEAAADADLPARRPTRVDEVERELQRPRAAAVQAPEVDPEQGRVLRPLGHRDRGAPSGR